MGAQDKASNKAQDIKGKVEEVVGKTTGDEKLEDKGNTDQAKSAVKGVGEKLKDATSKLKDAIIRK